MKNFKVKWLLLSIILSIASINTTRAAGQYNQNWRGNVFFRAPDNWNLSTNSHVQIAITRSSSASTKTRADFSAAMTRVGSTRLYYIWLDINHSSWNQYEYIAFVANSSDWGGADDITLSNCACYTKPYDYGVNNDNCPYLFTPGSEGNNATLSGTCYTNGSSYGDRIPSKLNVSQTVNLYTNGSSSNTGGSVNIATYQVTGNTTVDSGGNTDNSTASVNRNAGVGSTVTLTATEATGYDFDGWYEASSGGTAVSTSASYSYTCKGTKTLYARFKPETYEGTIDKNGGAADKTYTATYDATSLTITSAPTRTGYTVAGYYTNATCTTMVANASKALQASTTYTNSDSQWKYTSAPKLYAGWTANRHSVTLDKNGGDSNGTATSVYDSTSIKITKAPLKDGYDVEGYYLSDGTTKVVNANGTLVKNISGYTSNDATPVWINDDNCTLYAHWTAAAVTYTLTFAPGSGYTSMGEVTATVNGSDASSGSLYSEGASVVVTSNPGTHNRTAGWYSNIGCTTEITGDGAPGTEDTYSFSLSGNTTVYVKFEVSQTDITLNKNGGSTGATDVTATHGEVLPSFTAHARSGYTLQGYYTESSGGTKVINANGSLVKNVTGYTTNDATPTWNNKSRTMTLYAQWSEDKEAISMSVSYDHGTSSYTATAANTVGIETTSRIKCSKSNSAHYTFAGWTLTNLTVTSGNKDNDTIIYVKKTSAAGATPAAVANYNEVLDTDWALKGTFVDDFGTAYDFKKKSGESTGKVAYTSLTLAANTNYQFKVITGKTWYGNNNNTSGETYWIKSSVEDWTFYSDNGNCYMKSGSAGLYTFKIDYSGANPKISVEYPSQFIKGTWDSWTEHPFDDYGCYRVELEAGTYSFCIMDKGDAYKKDKTFSATTYDEALSTGGTDCKISVASKATYVFGWNSETKKLSVVFPADTTKSKYIKDEYIYFDTRRLSSAEGGWNHDAFSTRYWLKNFASGLDYGKVECSIADTVETGIFYFKVPAENLGQMQINRMSTNLSTYWNTTSKIYMIDRGTATTKNLLIEETGHEAWSNNWTPQWAANSYCPPMKTAVLADNGTTKLAGSGTKADPYQIAVSSKIKVTAASSTAFNDDAHMTHKYNFFNGASSLANQTSATYEFDASSSTNVTYEIVVMPYNTYNSQSSTKRIKSDTIYYKTVPSYTITYNDNGAHSGEVPVDGNRYISGYNATAKTNSGSLAKEGYTFNGWNESEDGEGAHHAVNGAITISSANVVLYAEWVDDHTYYFSGATDDDWSTASNWTKGLVPNDLANTIYILKPVEIPASTTIKAAEVNIVTGGTYTRPYGQGTVPDCAGHLSIAAGGELVIDGELRRVADASDLETKVHTEEADLYIGSDKTHGNGALVMKTHDGTNKAIVEFYTKSHGDLAADQRVYAKNQFIGTPFNDCNDITYNYHNSWIYGVDYSGSAPAWKRVNSGEGMDPFKGYCVISADAEDHVYWMGGTLVASSNQTIGLHYLGSLTDQKENLLANSWTAPIRIQSFVVGDFTNADATIYIFNTGSPTEVESASPAAIDATSAGQWITIPISSGSWGGKTPTVSVIPSMQSFSIYSNNEDPSKTPKIKLDYDHLVLTPAKNGTAAIVPNRAPKADGTIDEEEMGDPEVLRLFVRGTSGFGDNVIMLAREDFTDGFDNGWDGRKVAGAEVAPQMYALTTDGNMAYNCVPDMEGTVLSFTKGTEDATYTFSFEYEGDDTWYLNDLKEQTSTLISELDTYTFTSMTGDNAARFVISHTPIAHTPTAIENGGAIDGANVRKLMIDGTLYIIRSGQMFTADGQVVK